MFRALQLFAGDFLDCVRIGLQRFHLVAQLHVFGIEAVDVFADFPNFQLRLVHGDEAMRAKNVVNDEREHEQAENRTAVLLQEIR